MADGVRVVAWSVVVHLGQAVTQPVSESRRKEHRWLARSLNGLGVDPWFRQDSAYLSVKQLSTEPTRVQHFVEPPADLPDDATIILDLSDAPYELLNEPLLAGLADGVGRMLAGGPRTILILLCKLPPESLLWEFLERDTAADGTGRVVVLDDEGALRSFGHGKRGFTPLMRDWPGRRRQASGTANERFERRVVTRLGHFATADGERCTPAWQDMRGAVGELTECLSNWIDQTGAAGTRMIVCGPYSREFRVAVVAAAAACGGDAGFAATPDELEDTASGVGNVLAFEYVRSGDTLGDFRRALPSWGVPVRTRALAVMAAPAAYGLRHPDLQLDVLAVRGHEDVQRSACARCLASAPRLEDPSRTDPGTGIDAATMWWMLDRVPWGPEGYGPPEHARYPYIPDFSAVFERFGDWIALKYEELLKGIGLVDDLVVVCAAEPAVRDLVKRLASRFQNQLVPVEIERDVIDAVAADAARAHGLASALDDVSDASETIPAWRRQLADLGGRETGTGHRLAVIALDEFNASGATARGLTTLLGAFGVTLDAYVPFVDWSGGEHVPGRPTWSLYSFYYPRPTG
ncbi:hypothetical protein DVA67_024100 [Solirubrobacter sp. CPCC 204708]|uniref:Uncharacterized protein n=1 Tax=Solirubrobacter deserti TaxID=2282478 RepID=A0ABT4RKS5_9ACTN|nr:hypothetical protein [Solirubrobacter deserti]MBE2319079.1 hypothetical protein [Solirubrobacter deserti]MDA0139158.1 hypothetical protein [Solirubrobacter deserti]